MKLRPSQAFNIPFLRTTGLACGCLIIAGSMAHAATLLEYWDFNNASSTYNNGTLGSFASSASAPSPAVNNGEVYNTTTRRLSSNAGGFANGPVFSNGYIDFNAVPGTVNSGTTGGAGWGVFAASTLPQASGDTTTNQGSLGLFVNTPVGTNPSLTLGLSSAGYSGLTLSFDARKAGNASSPLNIAWSYSLDGSNFISFTTPALSSSSYGSFVAYSFTLPTALDNVANFQLKADFGFTANNVGTSFAIDNLQLNAAQAIPEPKAIALLGLGGFALLLRRRARARVA